MDVDSIIASATIRVDDDGKEIVRLTTCGSCGRTWNDAAISSLTPTPAGRCPWEAEHEEPRFENRESVNRYPVTGSHNLISEGIHALESLYGTLDENPELSISEIEIYENTPIRATLSDDYGHYLYVWAPAGWVRNDPPQ